MNTYLRLLNYIRPYLKRVAVAMACTILASSANLYVPWIIKNVIDDVLTSRKMAMLNYIACGIVIV